MKTIKEKDNYVFEKDEETGRYIIYFNTDNFAIVVSDETEEGVKTKFHKALASAFNYVSITTIRQHLNDLAHSSAHRIEKIINHTKDSMLLTA